MSLPKGVRDFYVTWCVVILIGLVCTGLIIWGVVWLISQIAG